MLETVITLNLSFLVFTFGSLLVAIQVAGGQYTPRIIATTLLRDNVIRFTIGFFVFTMVFAVRVLSRMDERVHQFNTFMAVLLGVVSIMVFLYLIDHAARFLRPVSIVAEVGKSGVAVIESVYPERTRRPSPNEPARSLGSAERIVVNVDAPGVVLAVDLPGLVRLARDASGIIEFVPQVGDFLAVDEPLFRLYGGAATIDDHRLREAVVLGTERTMEQDPTFAFRILVDIGIKALSAAINDPTTAVLALDQLHRLLRVVGLRNLRGEEFRDEDGALRLVFRTPNWEDFVHLACTEIRHCGAGSVQIMRRMRSMLENLVLMANVSVHPLIVSALSTSAWIASTSGTTNTRTIAPDMIVTASARLRILCCSLSIIGHVATTIIAAQMIASRNGRRTQNEPPMRIAISSTARKVRAKSRCVLLPGPLSVTSASRVTQFRSLSL